MARLDTRSAGTRPRRQRRLPLRRSPRVFHPQQEPRRNAARRGLRRLVFPALAIQKTRDNRRGGLGGIAGGVDQWVECGEIPDEPRI